MRNRVLRNSVVLRFMLIGILLISYLTVRTIKYEIFIGNEAAIRYIRYLYFTFPPVLTQLVFLTSLYVGKSERENISKFWKLLWIPTSIAVIFTITNDYHGLVFSLDPSNTGLNQYGPIFYLVIIYIGLLALFTLAITMLYSFKNKHLTSVKLPIFIIFIWGIYTFLYMIAWEPFEYFKIIFKSAEFNILMVVLFIESLVFMRLLPSNRGYESFLQLSSLNIGIMDSNGEIIFSPNKYRNIDPYLIEKSLHTPVLIDEDTLLESANINGGKSFWFIDLSDFNKLKRKLLNMSEDMLNENELLKAKNALKKNMVKVEEQREIREHIHMKLKPQFDQLKYILMNLPEDENLFEIKLTHACFLDVYIKRYSNLFLITKNKKSLELSELKLAFSESLDYLKLSGVKTSMDWKLNGRFDAGFSLDLYEIFQYALEFYMPGIDSLHVSLYRKKNNPELSINLKGARPGSFLSKYGSTYEKCGFLIEEDMLDGEINLCISLARRNL
ncbi:hypothetical protein VLK81_04600 [Citroniella saccharovorans]|uniref:Histidine kinase N-terminal 7TM region domain-containing protein n=1 Tax=Citroniella saccharovorans TaxID=2053367 RepID=A0AAW9MXJ3_9FIRM|nr:hypothetical protein [Citroniella saccharovorans]MEB3429300.1 hypothetical protein [Citroniella saccharovorans]